MMSIPFISPNPPPNKAQSELNECSFGIKRHMLIVLMQPASSYFSSDPGVSYTYPPNPAITIAYARGASADKIAEKIGSIHSSTKITQTTKYAKDD